MKAKDLAKILMMTPDFDVVCQEGFEEITVSGEVDTVEMYLTGDFSVFYIKDLVEPITCEVKKDFLLIRSKKITDI